MRLSTIWTTYGLTFAERLRRTRDCLAMAIASKLPLRIRFWVTMLEIGKAISTSSNIPATPLDELLKNLDKPKIVS